MRTRPLGPLEVTRRRSRLQQLRRPDRRGGVASRDRRRARRRRHVLRHRRRLRRPRRQRDDHRQRAAGRRDQVVLATKFGSDMGDGASAAARATYIRAALEASLRRLQTDVIDLYQHHREDPTTPLEETFGALDELVAEGKIRAYGTSNYEPETLRRAKAIAGDGVRLGAERVLVARARGGGRAAADLRRARARLHPVLPARVRAAHRQGLARHAAGPRHAAARPRDRRRPSSSRSSACASGRTRTA